MARKNLLDPIPHPPRHMILGNMLTLDSEAPLQDMMQLVRELGPIFWLDMFGTPVIVVSGFSLVDELCDETRFDKAVRGSLRRVRSFAGDGLFTADTREPNWAKAHHILLPTFSHRSMQTYHPMMLDIAEQLMQKWTRLNADDEIDVVHDMTGLTLDTIGLCGFDYRFNSFYRRDYHPFVDAMVRSLETAMKLRGLPLEDLMTRDRRRQLKADVEYMNSMVDGIVRERRESAPDGHGTQDLLGYMLSGVDKATGERLDDVNIRYQINTFLIAGHETTSGLLSFATYFLLNNPNVLAKAQAEADRVLGPDPSVQPTYAQVNQLTYITQILKESLRLWPTAPAFSLYPYKDEVIGGIYRLKKRSFVNVLNLMLHRDKSVWGERAEIFDPENFSREAEAARPANAYKPFGNGQRGCIGRQFAMHEATLVVGMILQRFQLVDHTRYKLKVKETLTIKPDGFKIKVRVRPPRVRPDAPPIIASRPTLSDEPAPPRPAHNTPLLVLYGSNLGTSEEFARQIAEAAELKGFATDLATLDAYAGRLPTTGAVAMVSASYNGAAPDNATAFCRWLDSGLPADTLAGVKFTVFGCGNRDWAATYQSIPRLIENKLAAAGAHSLQTRGEADAREDMDGQFQTWSARLWPAMSEALGIDLDASAASAEPVYRVETVAKTSAAGPTVAGGVMRMRVLDNRELQTTSGLAPSERSTRHVEVELPDGVTYRPGDHLSVVPRNSAALAERAAAFFGFEAGAEIRLRASSRRAALPLDEAMPVRHLLADYVELQAVATRKQIQTLAAHTECPVTKPKLLERARDGGGDDLYRTEVWAKRMSVLDLLETFPAAHIPFAAYLEMLPLLVPRYYSIASSPLTAPGRCAITVGVVEGPARSGRGLYRGVCSAYLAAQVGGSTIQAIVRETKAAFRLPADPSVPIIMIGPGTGLAPFRGFLQERSALKAQGRRLGPAMLFFGCRHPEIDFIYADELKRFAADGITELHVAFSRQDGKRTYVQDLIRLHADQVWTSIEAGAIIYVCGDGSRMEPDVKRALIAIYVLKNGGDEAGAAAWLDGLGTQGRYALDVWATA